MKIITVTGYKPHELGIYNEAHEGIVYIKKAIMKALVPMIEAGTEWVLISGQLGAELWAAEVVLQLQELFPDVKLAVLTPFLEQDKKWSEERQALYEMILASADFTDSITKRPYENPGQFKLKNKFLIAKSDGLLIFYDEDTPSSAKFMLEEAQKKQGQTNYQITTITPYDIQLIVEDEQYFQDF